MKKFSLLSTRAGALFLTPAAILVALFVIIPFFWVIFVSFTNRTLLGSTAVNPDFVGFANYLTLFNPETFFTRGQFGFSLILTTQFVILSALVGQALLGLLLAWLMQAVPKPLKAFTETFVIAAWIVVEAISRFAAPVPVIGKTMLAVAFAGLAANIAAFMVLHGGNRDNLNMRGAWLHVMGDMLGSVAAIVAAAVILATGWTPIDPILSIVVALIILKSAWGIVKSSAHILLEGTPVGVTLADIKTDLETHVPEIRDAHHIHAWSITGEQHMVTLHVLPASGVTGRDAVGAVQRRLAARFSIAHATVQVEEDVCLDTSDRDGATACCLDH